MMIFILEETVPSKPFFVPKMTAMQNLELGEMRPVQNKKEPLSVISRINMTDNNIIV